MASEETRVELNVKEIYVKLCPKCKGVIRKLIKDKLSDQVVNKMVGGE